VKKQFPEQVVNRIKSLIIKLISPSFLTWAVLFWVWASGRVEISSEMFLIFTASVIGLKKYLEKDKPNG